MFEIDNAAMQALFEFQACMELEYMGESHDDEWRVNEWLWMSTQGGFETSEQVLDKLALGLALYASGYRLHHGPRNTHWRFDVPDVAIAHRVVTAGYIATSECRQLQYVVKQ
jgi:hypothetical protein